MDFLRHRKVDRSFDLFSKFDSFSPDLGGIIVLLLCVVAGGLMGQGLMALLGMLMPEGDLQPYRNLIAYPIMFIPAMLYASVMSFKEHYEAGHSVEEEYPMDQADFDRCNPWILLPAVSVATLALSFVIEPLSLLLPPMDPAIKAGREAIMDGPVITTLISVSLFAPFFEEWLCRGMVTRGMLVRMHPAFAITIGALFFALIHMNIWQALPAFFFGLFFGWVYYKTGSLKLAMLMHCVNNTCAFLIGRMDSMRAVESYRQLLPEWTYWGIFAGCLLLLGACIWYVSRIRKTPQTPKA